MANLDTLWSSGRSGRENHVSKIFAQGPDYRIRGILPRNDFPIRIQADDFRAMRRQLRNKFLLRQQDRDIGVFDHQSETFFRKGWIKWDISAAGLQDTEQSDQH